MLAFDLSEPRSSWPLQSDSAWVYIESPPLVLCNHHSMYGMRSIYHHLYRKHSALAQFSHTGYLQFVSLNPSQIMGSGLNNVHTRHCMCTSQTNKPIECILLAIRTYKQNLNIHKETKLKQYILHFWQLHHRGESLLGSIISCTWQMF